MTVSVIEDLIKRRDYYQSVVDDHNNVINAMNEKESLKALAKTDIEPARSPKDIVSDTPVSLPRTRRVSYNPKDRALFKTALNLADGDFRKLARGSGLDLQIVRKLPQKKYIQNKTRYALKVFILRSKKDMREQEFDSNA